MRSTPPGHDLPRARRISRLAGRGLSLVLALAALGSIVLLHDNGFVHSVSYRFKAETHPQTTWASCNRHAFDGGGSTFRPLSDRAAAALVTPEPETRPNNAKPYSINGTRHAPTNSYVPANAQLAKFRGARTSLGQPVLQFNPYLRYVDGRDGLPRPSTDELIQWGAHKWGIPENWLRAEYLLESNWNSFMRGDQTRVSTADYRKYPPQSRIAGTRDVYQSLGITQVRWDPRGDFGAGAEPLRWQSTAFNIDFQAATVRLFYDNPSGARTTWGDATYRPCQKWNSIGGWFASYPWANAGQAQYISSVQYNLARRTWTSPEFLGMTLPIPPGVRLR